MTPWTQAFLNVVRSIAREAHMAASRLRPRRGDLVVNIHDYALPGYEALIRKYYADERPRILALSMNPGRNGAVQTGIPFCDAPTARELLPDFDRLVERPEPLRSEQVEMSGQKINAWARHRFGGLRELYARLLFANALPIAVLRGPNQLNVPIPALGGKARRVADAFYERQVPRLVAAAAPRGVLLLGTYAGERWISAVKENPDLRGVPAVVSDHPAARITNRGKHRHWTRAFQSLDRASGGPQRLAAAGVVSLASSR